MHSLPTPIVPAEKLRSLRIQGDALWRVSLAAPKGNVLDSVMTAELREVFRAAADQPELRAVLLTAEGPHFSFGASVAEHRADQARAMLAGFHGLFADIFAASVPVIAAVRGACLGGGLELVASCQRIFAHPGASFGQPEITLGVFAPVASFVLAERIGRAAAEDLLLSGRRIQAGEALELGLVDELSDEPESQATAWAIEHLVPHSATALRMATRAARTEYRQRFEATIAALEELYLGPLMATHDANEGIAAFMEKREPKWSHA